MQDESSDREQLRTELYRLRERVWELEREQVEQRRTQKVLGRISRVFLAVSDDEMYAGVLDVVREAIESDLGVFGFIADNGDLVIPSMTRHVWVQCQVAEKSVVFPQCGWGRCLGPSYPGTEGFPLAGAFPNTRRPHTDS